MCPWILGKGKYPKSPLNQRFAFSTLEWIHSKLEWIHSSLEWIHSSLELIHSNLTFPNYTYTVWGWGCVHVLCVAVCSSVHSEHSQSPTASHCQLSQQSAGRDLTYKWRHGAQQGYLMATTEWMEHSPSPGGWTGTLWRWRMRITPSTTDPGLNMEIMVFNS